MGVSVTANELLALAALAEQYGDDSNCLTFAGIAEHSSLPRKLVRRTVRALARKGLAEYVRGLFDEDGMVAGSGYCCTRAGKKFMEDYVWNGKAQLDLFVSPSGGV